MKTLRIISIILLTIILIPVLLLNNLFLTLDLSYNVDNIAENTKPLIEENLENSEISINEAFERQCTQTERENLPFPVGEIPCSKIEQSDNEFKTSMEHIYNQEYDCEYLNCYYKIEGPGILISEKTNENISSIFWTITAITLALLAILFFVFKRNNSFMLHTGILFLALSPTTLLIKNSIAPNLLSNVSGQQQGIMQNALGIFFGNAETTTIIWAIIGIALIAISIIRKSKNKKKS